MIDFPHLRSTLSNFIVRERQITSRIGKWKLDKYTQYHESLFMYPKQRYRRTHEPQKLDYKFEVREKRYPPEKPARREERMATQQGVRVSPGKPSKKKPPDKSVNSSYHIVTPTGITYYAPVDSATPPTHH